MISTILNGLLLISIRLCYTAILKQKTFSGYRCLLTHTAVANDVPFIVDFMWFYRSMVFMFSATETCCYPGNLNYTTKKIVDAIKMLVKPVYFSLRHKHKHKHKHNGKHIFLGMRRMKNYYIIGSIPPRYRKEWRTMIVLMLSAAFCHLKKS